MKSFTSLISAFALAATITSQSVLAACPPGFELPGTVVAPDLTVPVSKANPNKGYGDSHGYTTTTVNDFGTVQNFHLPLKALGKKCSLYFSLPSKEQSPGNTDYVYSGEGHFQLKDFLVAPTKKVTYNTLPPTLNDLGTMTFKPGNFYHLSDINCPVGDIGGVMFSNDTNFQFTQTDANGLINGAGAGGCPVGLFTTYA